jgi:uncharacterized membrane protein
MTRAIAACLLALVLAACQPGGDIAVPGDSKDHAAFAGITPDETIHFLGTEPFWGGESSGEKLTYSSPDDEDGTSIAIKRFSGRGGISLSGMLAGKTFDMTITPGKCSDGMSYNTYPFEVALRIGNNTWPGCAWTDAKGFTGPENP